MPNSLEVNAGSHSAGEVVLFRGPSNFCFLYNTTIEAKK